MFKWNVYYPIYYAGLDRCYWQKLMEVDAVTAKWAIQIVEEIYGPPKKGFYRAEKVEE